MPATDPGPLRLALIGEAPGADEVAQGYPFAGKSGWLLNQWLASSGISRHSCFVGNVCQMRPSPTSNDFHLLDWHGLQVQSGIAALAADLARFKPNCVLALGNAALHLLRHGNVAPPKSARGFFIWSSHVGTWRGSLFLASPTFDPLEASDLRLRDGRCPAIAADAPPALSAAATLSNALPVPATFPIPNKPESGPTPRPLASPGQGPLAGCAPQRGAPGDPAHAPQGRPPFKSLATYHPASTFRDPSFTYPLVSDLKRAVAEARSPLLELPPRRIEWGLAIDDLEGRCAEMRAARLPVGFDIEGGLGGLHCCSFAITPHDAFVVDLMALHGDGPRTYAALASVLEDPLVPKVCWNAAYERAILHAVASITLRGYEDGMLAWWERFSELPKGLDFVASVLTREPYWAEGIGWDKKTGAPKVLGPPFWTYNALDSLVTLEIWQHPLIRAVVESRAPVPFSA